MSELRPGPEPSLKPSLLRRLSRWAALDPLPDATGFAVLFASYLVAARFGLTWGVVEGAGSPIWPAAGIGAAGLVLGGIQLWPAIFLARLAAAWISGSDQPLWAELAIALCIAWSTVAGVLLLRRWRITSDLSNLISVLRFFALSGLVKAALSAGGGSLVLSLSSGLGPQEAWALFGMWVAGDVAGLLAVGPLILGWQRNWRIDKPFYLVLIALAVALVSWLVFMKPEASFFRIWHVLPLLLWAALAYQIRGASLALVIMSVFATIGTTEGLVYFAEPDLPPIEHIPHLQHFLAITCLTVLVIAAIDAERRQRGEDRLRLALDAAGQGSFEIDLRSGTVSGDEVAMRLLGLPQLAHVGFERLVEAVHPQDRALVREAIRSSADRTGNGAFRVESRVNLPDGTHRWVALHGSTGFDGDSADRRPLATRGVIRDVTARKCAEQKVLDSERFTRRVLDNLFAFVGVLDPDGVLLQANRAPLDAAGIPSSEVIGRKFWNCYWWSYSPKVQQQLKRAIRKALQGELVRFDVQVRIAGGQLIWIDFQIAPLRDEQGRVTHLIPSGIDMTARMEAEQESRRLISILEATPDFIGTADVAGRVMWLNPGARRIAGLAHDADVAKFSISELHSRAAHTRIVTEGFPIAAERGVWEGESDIIGADGKQIPVSQVIVPHRDDLGRVMQYSTIMRDISEQKRAQQHQAILLRELSHRVKNTLAVIQSIARQTLRTSPEPAQFAEVFQGRIASLAASHTLLTDTDWQGAELDKVIEKQLLPLMGDRRTRLKVSGPTVVLPAEPATQLGLVVHELGTNATKHGALSSERGRVEISWRELPGGLRFHWAERGGPPVSAPAGNGGFGSRLIDMSVRDIERRFEQEGLEVFFTLDLPRRGAGDGLA